MSHVADALETLPLEFYTRRCCRVLVYRAVFHEILKRSLQYRLDKGFNCVEKHLLLNRLMTPLPLKLDNEELKTDGKVCLAERISLAFIVFIQDVARIISVARTSY